MSTYDVKFDRLVREIFEGCWCVSVNIQDLRSDEDLRQDIDSHYGAPEHVLAASREIIQTYITINRMVELWKKQRSFTIHKSTDVKAIYDIIHGYINVFIERTKDSVNSGSVPIDDLIALDELAHYLYPTASRSMALSPAIMARFGMKGIRSKQEILGKTTEAEKKTAPSRYRLADSIVSLHKG